MNFDSLYNPYHMPQLPKYGKNGMVATSQNLASQAGLEILKEGGNAVDAAIATAACLTVVEPTSNGIGGDAFALVWMKDKLHGLNSSGPAPKGISIEKLKEAGFEKMPTYGWEPVTVPGVPGAWAELSDKFGKLPLTQVLEPAIKLAREGFPVSPIVSKFWNRAYKKYKQNFKDKEIFKSWFDTFTFEGKVPIAGQIVKLPDHADTLEKIAKSHGRSFYEGELADRIETFSKENNGYLRKSDLETYNPEWVNPISVNYRGYDVWEIPPNGQGLVALMALNILEGYDFNSKEDIGTYHKQMEAMKLAFVDGKKYITEADQMRVDASYFLSKNYGTERRKLIKDKAKKVEPVDLPKSGTVYLATADSEGNMVSYIQSNYMGFGSGLVVPGTGIALQNRGHNFSLDPKDDNCLKPGKRTYHTIIPGFLTKNSEAIGPFGVMGGFMQPQGHVQVVMNMIDFNLNPQAALNAPRWQWLEDTKFIVEQSMPEHIVGSLIRKGHDIEIAHEAGMFGRGQIIIKKNNGTLIGGCETRCDSSIATY